MEDRNGLLGQAFAKKAEKGLFDYGSPDAVNGGIAGAGLGAGTGGLLGAGLGAAAGAGYHYLRPEGTEEEEAEQSGLAGNLLRGALMGGAGGAVGGAILGGFGGSTAGAAVAGTAEQTAKAQEALDLIRKGMGSFWGNESPAPDATDKEGQVKRADLYPTLMGAGTGGLIGAGLGAAAGGIGHYMQDEEERDPDGVGSSLLRGGLMGGAGGAALGGLAMNLNQFGFGTGADEVRAPGPKPKRKPYRELNVPTNLKQWSAAPAPSTDLVKGTEDFVRESGLSASLAPLVPSLPLGPAGNLLSLAIRQQRMGEHGMAGEVLTEQRKARANRPKPQPAIKESSVKEAAGEPWSSWWDSLLNQSTLGGKVRPLWTSQAQWDQQQQQQQQQQQRAAQRADSAARYPAPPQATAEQRAAQQAKIQQIAKDNPLPMQNHWLWGQQIDQTKAREQSVARNTQLRLEAERAGSFRRKALGADVSHAQDQELARSGPSLAVPDYNYAPSGAKPWTQGAAGAPKSVPQQDPVQPWNMAPREQPAWTPQPAFPTTFQPKPQQPAAPKPPAQPPMPKAAAKLAALYSRDAANYGLAGAGIGAAIGGLDYAFDDKKDEEDSPGLLMRMLASGGMGGLGGAAIGSHINDRVSPIEAERDVAAAQARANKSDTSAWQQKLDAQQENLRRYKRQAEMLQEDLKRYEGVNKRAAAPYKPGPSLTQRNYGLGSGLNPGIGKMPLQGPKPEAAPVMPKGSVSNQDVRKHVQETEVAPGETGGYKGPASFGVPRHVIEGMREADRANGGKGRITWSSDNVPMIPGLAANDPRNDPRNYSGGYSNAMFGTVASNPSKYTAPVPVPVPATAPAVAAAPAPAAPAPAAKKPQPAAAQPLPEAPRAEEQSAAADALGLQQFDYEQEQAKHNAQLENELRRKADATNARENERVRLQRLHPPTGFQSDTNQVLGPRPQIDPQGNKTDGEYSMSEPQGTAGALLSGLRGMLPKQADWKKNLTGALGGAGDAIKSGLGGVFGNPKHVPNPKKLPTPTPLDSIEQVKKAPLPIHNEFAQQAAVLGPEAYKQSLSDTLAVRPDQGYDKEQYDRLLFNTLYAKLTGAKSWDHQKVEPAITAKNAPEIAQEARERLESPWTTSGRDYLRAAYNNPYATAGLGLGAAGLGAAGAYALSDEDEEQQKKGLRPRRKKAADNTPYFGLAAAGLGAVGLADTATRKRKRKKPKVESPETEEYAIERKIAAILG